MTTLQAGNLKGRLLAAAAVLLLTAALTWLLRDAVRDAVVRPITYLLWLSGLFLGSVPERVLLAALTLAGVYVAVRSLTARARAESAPPPAEPRRGEESRLRFWRIQFHYAPGSAFAAEKLAAELRNLIFDLLEHQERMNRDEVAHAAATGALELPPPVRALLLEQQHWSPAGEIDSLQRLREMLYALLRKPPPEAAPSPFEQDVELVVAWIEGRLKEPGVA